MITKTLNLDDAYQELFDEVRAKSEGAIDVNNLDAFYGSIEEIAAVDPKFLRLPLDEPLFDIDANSRKITVPAEFKSNGVSVQRDHLAEVIFFRIERYFDYTDLSTCDIVINWKMGAKEGKTTRFIKFEKVFTIDETQSSYVVFGWPINDIVTEKSGTLSFAVEFFKTEGTGDSKEVIYRFNTLPATINVKDGLIIDENIEPLVLDSDIIRTLVNSSFGEGTAAVGDISWLTGNGQGLVLGIGANDSVILQDFASSINLSTLLNAGVPSSAPANLYAVAYVDEGTEIRYTDAANTTLTAEMLKVGRPLVAVADRNSLVEGKVYYTDISGLNVANAETLADEEVDLFEVMPLETGLRYYVIPEDSTPDAAVLASEEDLAKWGMENAPAIYVKAVKITAEAAGEFLVKAQGQKFDANGVKIGSGDTSSSAIVTVPSAEKPSDIEISVSTLDEVGEGYSFDENSEANVVFLNDQGEGLIDAKAVVNSFGALQFVWQKKDGNEFRNISEETVAFQEENDSILTVSEAGDYKVQVTNFQNGENAPMVESMVVTASPLAGKITSAILKYKIGSRAFVVAGSNITFNSSGNLSSNTVTLKVDNCEFDGPQGILQYQWQKQVWSEDEATWENIQGANSDEFLISSGDGAFRPVVMNNYNGSVYTYVLNSVSVDDISG